MYDLTALTAVLIMCLVTFVTRVGGLMIMSWFPITPRIIRVLDALTGSTLVAMVLPSAMNGDRVGLVTILIAAAVMFISKNTLAAMLSGVVAAALWRAAF